MSFEPDEEILQDFLVEAGEILEHLSEQLVDLEQRPDDFELLNAIFRGFHTIKGGAGFLQLNAMVDLCHIAENIFDALRNGERHVDADLMDVMLKALDGLHDMFTAVNAGEEPEAAEESLIDDLKSIHETGKRAGAVTESTQEPDEENHEEDSEGSEASGQGGEASSTLAPEGLSDESDAKAVDESQESSGILFPEGPASDRNVNKLIQSLKDDDGSESSPVNDDIDLFGESDVPAPSAGAEDEITEEEFDQLVLKLKESGGIEKSKSVAGESQGINGESTSDAGVDLFGDDDDSSKAVDSAQGDVTARPAGKQTSKSEKASGASQDEINDDEFEALLDQLHGKGKHGGVPDTKTDEAGDSAKEKTVAKGRPASSGPAAKAGGVELISDDEFDNLLDDLHGVGKGPTAHFDNEGGAKKLDTQSKSSDANTNLGDAAQGKGGEQKTGVADVSEKGAQAASQGKATTGESTTTALVEKAGAKSKGDSAVKRKPAGKENSAVVTETTVRVDTQRLDDIMNMVGELVLVRNRLVRLGVKNADESMAKAVANLDVVTADLQMAVMKTRMQPIKKVFGRFPRVVRDLARNLKKEITLEMQGEETDLDKNLVEALADPLVHLVRNSVDHGIESPRERKNGGKPETGKIILAAVQEGDHIVLSITDDGRGMNPQVLRDKAVEKGLMDQEAADRLSDDEAFHLIFSPGFSTKEKITDVSGRGVGMDVVKNKITQLNGTVDVKSVLGEGTHIAIKVPLTLAIMPTLMVMLEKQTFALPLVSVNEIFHLDLGATNIVDGQEVIIVRGKPFPLFYLKKWLVNAQYGKEELCTETAHVVIVSVGTQKVGFVVDQLIGQEEVVIKPLGTMLHGTPGMAGATITGDGRIALILDVPSMLGRYT